MTNFGILLVNALVTIFGCVLTYQLSKRAKVDDVRIKRRQELAEKIAVALQIDHDLRESIMDEFTRNLKHLDRGEAIAAFKKHADTLYTGMCTKIEKLQETTSNLAEPLQQGAIYFDGGFEASVRAYLSNSEFTYMTDGCGGLFVNTYAERFFENLFDEKRVKSRRDSFTGIMDTLRNLKH